MSTTSTTPRRPSRLPASALPEGCLPWDSTQTLRWTRALAPRWVPVRIPRRLLLALVTLALLGGCGLAVGGTAAPVVAAVLALQLLWLLVRPEVVRITAVLQIVLVVWLPPDPARLLEPAGVLMAGVFAWAAHLRLRARTRQRDAALAAAGGVTAVLPDAKRPLRRGKLFIWLGLVILVAGAVLVALAPLAAAADDRRAGAVAGVFLAGVGLTMSLSGVLGRRRAAALRSAPAPVLKVLVREGRSVDTEVFAVDDLGALRPLFTVAVTELDDDPDGPDDASDAPDDAFDDPGGEDDEPGPLREAVLYGAPYDGAEVLIVSAAEEPGEPPVVQRSIGPVRPVSDGRVRFGLRVEKQKAKLEATYGELSRSAAQAVAGDPYRLGGKGVLRWRAGWPDWLTAAGAVVWAVHFSFWGETGVFRYGVGGAMGVVAVLLLPRWIAWRVTADSEGLWFNGFRRAQHIAWDHIRVVECKGNVLKIDSRRASFDEFSVSGFRWPWLERKLGKIHPYERAAAEIEAMWRDPSLRPLGVAGERERGRLLWPLGVVVALVWAALLLFAP
ncbi:hypothetical protein ABZ848_35020 [Streptomyces sp. NPDC047081]|uniref:hypothetical protein n=1 Tax=Streptomyces sp. NPDC047081 TaxID=3154706 RepID=UPI0033C19E70